MNSIKNTLLSACLALLALTGFSCLEKTEVKLVSISIGSEELAVHAGDILELRTVGVFSDGSTSKVDLAWTSSSETVAEIYADSRDRSVGVVVALKKGLVTAVARSVEKPEISSTVQIEVLDPILESISVTPAACSVASGLDVALSATGSFSNGTTGPVEVDWSSSDESIATVAEFGLVTAVALGSAEIIATAKADPSISAVSSVSVLAAVPVSISIAPNSAVVNAGLTAGFAATVTWSDGSVQPAAVVWGVSDPLIATVDQNGIATAVSPGSASVTAAVSSNPAITASAAITVLPARLVSLGLSPASAQVAISATVSFTATGTYSDGSSRSEAVTWASSDATIATVDSAGVATGLSAGQATITAAATSDTSITATATLQVRPPFDHLYINNAYYTSGQGIYRVPYAGGAPELFDATYTFNISGLCLSPDKSKLYLLESYGNVYEIDMATKATRTAYSRGYYQNGYQSLTVDSNGFLYTFIGGATGGSVVDRIDPVAGTRSVFCSTGGLVNIFDAVMVSGTLYVSYWGGVAKATHGGTLQTVWTGGLMSSIDIGPNGTLYATDNWNGKIVCLKDNNNDGYFFSNGESWDFVNYGPATIFLCELIVDFTGDVYVAEVPGTTPPPNGIRRLRDTNADGDAMDSGEDIVWSQAIMTAASGGGNIGLK